MRTLITIVVMAGLVGCASATPQAAVLVDAPATTTTGAGPLSTDPPATVGIPPSVQELPPTSRRSTTSSTTASTTGSAGATGASDSGGTTSRSVGPVTTIEASSATPADIYRGVVGKLDRDHQVSTAAGPQPEANPGIWPLTGLEGEVVDRPAAVVKIDNGGPARPQSGLNAADIVVEEEVEGGITRLAAIFHSQSAVVGPVRSGRTTDIGIINGLGSPVLIYSGANSVTDALLRAQPTVQNRSAATSSGYWRSSSRRAPSNLYTDTGPHWATAGAGPARPQFHFRSPDEPVSSGDDGVVSERFSVHYRSNTVGWSWDGSAYYRTQGGRAHNTAEGEQVNATNVVVIEAKEVATGMVDGSGANVPEFVFVGSGPATVHTGGRHYEATWTRPSLADSPVLTSVDGSLVKLNPGRTWIELVATGSQP